MQKQERIQNVLNAMLEMAKGRYTITTILERHGVQPRVSTVLQELGVLKVEHRQPVQWLSEVSPNIEFAERVDRLSNSDKFRNRKRSKSPTAKGIEPAGRLPNSVLDSFQLIALLKENEIIQILKSRGFEIEITPPPADKFKL